MRQLRFLTILAVGLAACHSDTTSPTQELDVPAIVDQMSTSGMSYALAGASAAGGAPIAMGAPTGGPPSCAYSAASQRFECAPMTFNGMTMTRAFQLLDAAGHALTAPDPSIVASIRTITDMTGTLVPPPSPRDTLPGAPPAPVVTMDRHEDATMSGLLTANHVMNSTSSGHTTMTFNGSTFNSTESSTTTNLRLPPPPTAPTATPPYPLGGTITTDRTFTPSSSAPPMTSHEVITFDGTSVMTMTRTSNGVTMTCKIDLANRGTMPVCR